MDWKIFGHQNIKNILEKQILSGKLPHAYLFSGPSGVGKKLAAMEFARRVLNAEKLENHPDFHILDPQGEIMMEQILDFIRKISYKPFLGPKKVSVINNAENLNTQSANALLKTLEEPGQSSVIILIAKSRAALLPTIVSRCQALNFNIFSRASLLEFSNHNRFKHSDIMIDLSFGRPGRLKRLSEDKNFFEKEKATCQQYETIVSRTLGEKFSSIGKLAELEPEQLKENLFTWLFWQEGLLKHKPKDFFKVQALMDATVGIERSFNKKLLFQRLFVRI